MDITAGLIPLMLFLVPAVILLGTVVSVCIRKYMPARQGQVSSFYFGFLCGVLVLFALSLAAPWFARVAAPFLGADVGLMEILKLVVAVLGGFCIVAGILTVVAARFYPKLLEPTFLRWLTVGRLDPSRRNRTMMGACGIFMGAYLVLAAMDHFWLGVVAFLLSLPFAKAVQKDAGLQDQAKQH